VLGLERFAHYFLCADKALRRWAISDDVARIDQSLWHVNNVGLPAANGNQPDVTEKWPMLVEFTCGQP
jgi:hypothetical protein